MTIHVQIQAKQELFLFNISGVWESETDPQLFPKGAKNNKIG